MHFKYLCYIIFEIAKEQIEYLLSISFTWTEIAGLLGISRMTLYRYSNDYHSSYVVGNDMQFIKYKLTDLHVYIIYMYMNVCFM